MKTTANLIVFVLVLLQSISVLAQVHEKQTYCNPIDLDYKYGELIPRHRAYFKDEETICRSSADPVLINHKVKGKTEGYYLFGTSARGYWKSDDLLTWKHVSPANWPVSYLYGGKPQKPVEKDMIAPAAFSANDTLFVMPSSHHTAAPIYYSTDPASGHFEVYNKSLTFPEITNPSGLWDPALYFDEELDKWYLYYGSSNVYPIVGCELNPNKKLEISGPLKHLIYLYPDQHGWERFGWDHRAENRPSYMEGAWMTKHDGKYYLQYGAPETGDNIYGTGTYIRTSPLGPFTYAPNNPVGYKPGGFVNGVGHGNTFCDKYGNCWNTGTCWVGVNWVFERRIVMLPAVFDADGDMYPNSPFADFPHYVPSAKLEGRQDLFTGWMLLSYNKPCKDSSQMNEKYSAANVTNEDMRSYWVAASNKKGEALTLDLEADCRINAIQINYADFKVKPDLFEPLKKSEEYNGTVYSQ
ncbi:MAG: family 43 glycosylhydrolase, partial [Marinilabiliaceae bacterium]|nr:family 43 glycosylhydrolase [Marinilabiliaceae bacterium]